LIIPNEVVLHKQSLSVSSTGSNQQMRNVAAYILQMPVGLESGLAC